MHLKLYTIEQNEKFNSTTAEVIANYLAKEFELNVPQAALIEFDKDFMLQLKPKEESIVINKDERIKFGSLLLEPGQNFTEGLPKQAFKKRCKAGIDTLFAFDNFIRNADRGKKPNLLFHKKDAWLIDHEKAFSSIKESEVEFKKWSTNFALYQEVFFRYHICYNYLRASKKNTKLTYFKDFSYFLSQLTISKLNPYFNQLEKLGYSTQKQAITDYLQLIKKNYVKFEELLQFLISK